MIELAFYKILGSGRNCIIQPGVVIGADGFAYERHPETMELERFPHIGGVEIRDDVEICSIAL